ncbi:MAG: Sec-independent protein translocase protein TatB [Methyloceanibacter sp.]|nr:Sec-independent protein translocase protein TatB [Methyloceanibacter sp.]
MLDIGWTELLVVAIVAIVVVGPKDLPKLMRTVGFYVGKARRAAADFQRQFNEAVAESEAEEVRKNLEAIKANMGPAPDLSQPIGKPLMTGPSAPPETNFVTPPAATVVEPPLPEPPQKQSAEQALNESAAAKKPGAKKNAAKRTSAKKTRAKKRTPAKRKPKGDGPAEPAAENGELKP